MEELDERCAVVRHRAVDLGRTHGRRPSERWRWWIPFLRLASVHGCRRHAEGTRPRGARPRRPERVITSSEDEEDFLAVADAAQALKGSPAAGGGRRSIPPSARRSPAAWWTRRGGRRDAPDRRELGARGRAAAESGSRGGGCGRIVVDRVDLCAERARGSSLRERPFPPKPDPVIAPLATDEPDAPAPHRGRDRLGERGSLERRIHRLGAGFPRKKTWVRAPAGFICAMRTRG